MKKIFFAIVIVTMFKSCSAPKQESINSIEEIRLESETDPQAMKRIEGELLYRASFENKDSLKSLPFSDSIPRLGDTLNWRVIERRAKRDSKLSIYDTKSLLNVYNEKVIYGIGGQDDRVDWNETDSISKITSNQVACLIEKKKFKRKANGNYVLSTRLFSEAQYLCSAERFSSQPVAGFCSGFAIANNLIATAGHCASDMSISSFVIVFNFWKTDKNKDSIKMEFTPNEIYFPKRIVNRALDNSGMDFAIIEVDHQVPKSKIAKIRMQDVAKGDSVFVIGHPCGLPLKIAKKAIVVENSNNNFFVANLDTYGGNSGSPVFDSNHHVVGILVRGAKDFNYNIRDACYYSNVCQEVGALGCEGESVSRARQFINFISQQ